MNRLVDPRFQGVNEIFVLSFVKKDDRRSHSNYDLSKVEVNDYNVATDGKNIFDQPINNDFKTIENIASSQGDDYATGFLVDYPYFKPNHKMITIDLSK